MAIPPEPIEEVLPKAVLVLDAEVKEVLSMGPAPKKVEARAGASDTGQKTASQVVKLAVKRVLKGKTDVKELVVEKPEGGYALRAGNHGPFLLDGTRPNPVILGRYGPDSYAFSKIEAALKK
jgi:hypothetical protein